MIEYLIDKYKNDTKSIYYITQQLFDICDDNTDIKTLEAKAKQFYKYIEYFRSWDIYLVIGIWTLKGHPDVIRKL
ncbi:hypothetical protein rsib_orf981 [Rickettsia sibirica 246]|uniref:Uncharacterized protein n=1 Tax=Rickettsia sibirica (strain ATCC VR-151 / 246) TaxID=272951 RepID=Q7P9N0_RICS2|nr:hypothetical protein rsib_orf981 [Rickettsia sibirica 246]